MKSERMKIIKAASVYTGIILGAGFASGQELIQFFVRFGNSGVAGLIFSGLILSISGWAVMDICVRLKIKSYDEFIKAVLGKKLGFFMDTAVIIFIAILFCTMLAGVGALGKEAFNLPFTTGVLIFAALCFITFLFDLNGIVKINVILAPLLVIGGIFFGIFTMVVEYTPVSANSVLSVKKLTEHWAFAAVIYSSYNIITAVSVLSNMHEIVTSRKIAKYAGILGGFSMTLLGLCFALPLLINFDFISGLELPMLGLAHNYGKGIEYFYIFLLLAAIFTTVVSNGFAVIEWLSRRLNINKLIIKIMVTLSGIVIAHIGFSVFVSKAYPFFGYIGLFEIVIIVIFFIFGS